MMWLAADTHVGQKRKSNQDTFVSGYLSDGCYLVVCDGMGGEKGGGVASLLASKAVSEQLARDLQPDMNELSVRRVLQCASAAANAAVCEAAHDPALNGMGTTLVAAVVMGRMAHFAHAGDSRAYLLREDLLAQLTVDHTVVQMLIDRGDISVSDAKNHPQRHLITRAVGVSPDTRFDIFSIDVEPGDAILLCSDGLYNFMSHEDLCALAAISVKRQSVAPLINRANENGGGDNITAGLICVTESEVTHG
ncbi:MAG: Stp1/IreP family PP2C-type Ser/Thr phosphatase [Oscillospiraceae bacterium]